MSLRHRLLTLLASTLVSAWAPHAAASPLQGLWCGTGALRDFTLKLSPGAAFDQVRATLLRRGRAREILANVEGSTLRTQATRYGSLVLTAAGGELRITGGDGPLALVHGNSFKRAQGDACGRD